MKLFASLVVLLTLANVASAQTLGSCPIFPPNNPWNQRIDSLPVHPRSQSYINSVGASIHVHPDFGSNSQYGIPWVAVNGSQPFVPIDLTNGYIDESDPGPMPIPDNAPVEYPPPPGGDAHVLVVDTANHHLYELYQGIKKGAGWAATSSAIFALDSNKFRPDGWTSCDAAGLPIFPGLVRKYECDAGEIKHALRFTIQHSSRGYIFPARHYASSNTDTANVMPMGMRLRLKSTYDDSKFTGNAKVISTALKRYGIIMADNGSNWYISGENNTNWNDNDVGQLRAITGNDFEVVYTGPIRVRPNQYPDPDLSQPRGGTGGALVIRSVDFKSLHIGEHRDSAIYFLNTGSNPITITNISVATSPAFNLTSSTTAFTIQPGKYVADTVRFTPPAPGQFQATATITTDESSNNTYTAFAKGVGIGDGVSVSPGVLNFGNVAVGSVKTLRTWIFDTTNVRISLTGQQISDTTAFVTNSWRDPQLLSAHDSLPVDITFHPRTSGPQSGTYTFNIDGGTSLTVQLQGNGAATGGVFDGQPENFSLSILPNPAKSNVTLSLNGASRSTQLEFYDALGRRVMSTTISTDVSSFDLSALPSGEYFARVTSDGKTASCRITLEH